MQIKNQRPQLYRLKKIQASLVDETEYSKKAYERKEKVESYRQLRAEGSTEATILKALNISRATLHRWKRNYSQNGLLGRLTKS